MPKALIAILVIGAIVVACALPVVVGVFAKRWLKRTSPNSEFLKPLQAAAIPGVALAVLGPLLLVIAREFYPNSALGSLLQAPEQFIVASAVWLLAFSLIHKAFSWAKGKDGG